MIFNLKVKFKYNKKIIFLIKEGHNWLSQSLVTRNIREERKKSSLLSFIKDRVLLEFRIVD